MKKFLVFFVAISMILVVGSIAQAEVFQAGGDRLIETQYTDGSWGWPLNAPPTYGNIIGPIAMGLAQAYRQTGDADFLVALQSSGDYFLTKETNFSPSDGYLANELDSIIGGTTYTDHVMTNFYNPLAAGTYNRNGAGTLYDTAGYVNLIDSARAGQGIANLAAWDIGMGLYAANAVGADTTAWIAGTKTEIDDLAGGASYDVIGLAGAVLGLASVGENYTPTAGQYLGATGIPDLADELANLQLATGGFTWRSDIMVEGDDNESVQETAYAILALNEVDRANYMDSIVDAGDYLVGDQLGTGGWEQYGGSGENNEITGEALWGASTANPIPEPSTVILLGIGLAGLLGFRKKFKT